MLRNHRLRVAIFSSILLASCAGQPDAPTATPAAAIPTPPHPTAQDIAERLQSSTVRVRADFPLTPISDARERAGTGIVLDGGYIVTNAHIVEGGSAWTIAASGSPGERPAKLIGASTCDDIAVLKVDDTSGLQPAALGADVDVSVGEDVLALGYAETADDTSDLSVAHGTVSQKDERLDNYEHLIQIDAAISPSTSGGPLVNERGEVIGITTLGLSGAHGIHAALSIDSTKQIIEDLRDGVSRNELGINVVPNTHADYFGRKGGLVVVGIDSASPAEKLDIQPADLLLQLEGDTISSLSDMCSILRSRSNGERLRVSLLRVANDAGNLYSGEMIVGDSAADIERLAPITLLDTPTEQNAAGGGAMDNVTISDYDFASDTGAWRTGAGASVAASIGQGTYSITLKAANRYTAWPNTAIANGADMAIIAVLTPRGNARAGVATRYVDNGTTESYYACWIDAISSFGCVKYVNSRLTTLQESTWSSFILPGQENTLTLVAEGTKVNFNINGTDVAAFEDTALASGVPAIYVENFGDPAGVDVRYATIMTPK